MSRRTRQRDVGLTLIELLLAMGLLTVLLAMVGTVFPVAFSEARESREQTFGVLVAENALAVSTTMVDLNDPTIPTMAFEVIPDDDLDPNLRVYNPTDDPNDILYRWTALWKRDPGLGVVDLIVVPFQTYGEPTTTLEAHPLSVASFDPDARVKWMTFDNDPDLANILQEGAVVIDAATGAFATIGAVDVDNNRALLSNNFGEAVVPDDVLVMGLPIDQTPPGGGGESPAIYALMMRTSPRGN